MKNIYFISDARLGSRAIEHRRTQERRLVNFLDKIKEKAEAVYMLGDMFDFWFEYKEVVPRGYTRFLGKISELTDMGVEVHWRFEGRCSILLTGMASAMTTEAGRHVSCSGASATRPCKRWRVGFTPIGS